MRIPEDAYDLLGGTMTAIKLGNDFWKFYTQRIRSSCLFIGVLMHVEPPRWSCRNLRCRQDALDQGFVTNMDEQVDIFDYHGDIEIPGAETVLFSEATRYGFNPLVLNTDPHYGGVRR